MNEHPVNKSTCPPFQFSVHKFFQTGQLWQKELDRLDYAKFSVLVMMIMIMVVMMLMMNIMIMIHEI